MKSNPKFDALIAKAYAAGMAAGNGAEVEPMVVSQRADPLNDNSAVVKSWYVPSGVCGFAWINVKPATSSFARYLKAKGVGRTDSYYGGVTIWVGEFGQSMDRKEAFARAYANVLREAGFNAYMSSRMD